ncbi:hypothetical protein HELRODRAFT_87629 [Helobdella robusta]|uniref:Major facilitator superfamily (MFS) profile domain-containing protein n=1 Tax=Helobdella robusta TaxID=6412 RepID=T1G6T3_HELRO|nr:hypothetical protein HELRODRAFT_87629 [Helobdella robusta]ESN94799.1 hypothetical protein HELRODRAFT_87629 [Helobdella robusta]
MDDENVAVGLLFASNAVVHMIVNPIVGPITNRIGYSIPFFIGFIIMFASTLTFAFGNSYKVLFVARASQGLGSSCSTVSGLGMLANLYRDDQERGNALAIALGGLAIGALVGPTCGGVLYEFFGKETPFIILAAVAMVAGAMVLFVLQPKLEKEEEKGSSLKKLLSDPYIIIAVVSIHLGVMGYAALEPILPLHMIQTMGSSNWQQGMAFLPGSLCYLIGTYLVGLFAHKIGRWLSAMIGSFIISASLFLIPLATHFEHLIVPLAALGFAIGLIDSSIMPMMAHLVDIRHVSIYGNIYAITDTAFCLAFAVWPTLSGPVIKLIGFKGLMWMMAAINLLYSPIHIFLRNPPTKAEKEVCELNI